MLTLGLLLTLGGPAVEPARAETCLAHVNVMIAEAARLTGRVAGPSWFLRDWWSERLPQDGAPGALSEEQRREMEALIEARRTSDPERYRTELATCTDEAIEGGALP